MPKLTIIIFTLIIFACSCQQYSEKLLVGTWTSEDIAWQFNDSLALKYDGGVNEFFIYRYNLAGDEIEFIFLDSFIDYHDGFIVDIISLDNAQLTLKDAGPAIEQVTITYSRVDTKIPVIYPDDYPEHFEFYLSQLKESSPEFFHNE